MAGRGKLQCLQEELRLNRNLWESELTAHLLCPLNKHFPDALHPSIHPSIQSASFKCLSRFGLQGQSKQRFSLSLGTSSSSSTRTTSTKYMVLIFSFKSYQLQNDFDFVNDSPIEVKVYI